MLEQIVRLAEAIVQPSEAEQQLLTALCEAAEAELARRLREGLTPEDVSLRTGGGGQVCAAAAAMRRQAAGMMADYWGDDAFAFLGVPG